MKSPGLVDLALLAAAGAAGTLARFGVSVLCDRPALRDVPLGTFLVNATGCLVFGIVLGSFPDRGPVSPQAKWLMLTGFLGAFTTFSAFSFEVGRALHQGHVLSAAFIIVANNIVGIGGFLVGWRLSGFLAPLRGPV